MEIIQFVQNFISNVGFPIACVCVMFHQMDQERKAHALESEKTVEALNALQNAINRLSDRMEEKV